ncbi:transmembrane protein -like [Brachionus plicatilis]|uniref:Transmembrane protein-like n=1 Tax=Brachionus plicatilis TaxID=10195 RepID=A0A3M7R578_BRAPC|nr:transmembrane protein -like [Brachionus plicatilis]
MAADLAVRSLLPLQILLYLNQWYYIFWLIVESLCFVFKGQTLPFSSGVLAGEIILFIFLFFLDMFRIFFATKGNLTERIFGIVVSIILTAPCVGGSLYLLIWQHYVLRVELIINAIQLVFILLEFILEIIAIIVFARTSS